MFVVVKANPKGYGEVLDVFEWVEDAQEFIDSQSDCSTAEYYIYAGDPNDLKGDDSI